MSARQVRLPSPPIERVYVDKKAWDSPWTKRIVEYLPGIPCRTIRSPFEKRNVLEDIRRSADPLREGKKILYLTVQKGRFIKPCPCSPGVVGCGYYVINLHLQCPLDCSYCILQHYLSDPWLVVFTNLEDLWPKLDDFLERHRRQAVRIGTGELGDSLALDSITHFSRDLVSYFKGKNGVSLELKTKTADIRQLPKIPALGNIVISWSLNTNKIAAAEESGAPTEDERLAAARAAAARGYRIGFHFDPLVRYPGWAKDYEQTIRSLFQAVSASNIAWISLGALRFPPGLKKIIQSRFPASKIIYDEFVLGQDGKFRYFLPLRLDLFRQTASMIRQWGGDTIPLYLCMEGLNVWRDILKWKPRGRRAVERALSPRWNQRD